MQGGNVNHRQLIEEHLLKQLDLRDGKKSILIPQKLVDIDPQSYNLAIGLGSLGCGALLELKGMVAKTFQRWEDHLAFLGLDTDHFTFYQMKSSPETGCVKFSETEKVFLNNNNGLGANGVRQIGRLLGFANTQDIVNAIHRTAVLIPQDTHHINVFILVGIGGGTGGGLCIDIPLIVRNVLSEAARFAPDEISVFGYLFMPDVYGNAHYDMGMKAMIMRNAYATLQELDYSVSLSELEERYEIDFPQGRTLRAGEAYAKVYDYVHLISATCENGSILSDSCRVSIRTGIRSIMLVLIGDQLRSIGGKTPGFFYANLEGAMHACEQSSADLPHRSLRYLAIGDYSYELPMDDIMMYTAGLLFEHMNALFDKQPEDRDFTSACNSVGVYVNQVLSAFQAKVPVLQPPTMPTLSTMPPRDAVPDYHALAQNVYNAILQGYPAIAHQLHMAEKEIYSAMCMAFDNIMADCFKDPERGPIFASKLITRASGGIIDVITGQMHRLMDLPSRIHPDQLYQSHVQQVNEIKKKMNGLFGWNKRYLADYEGL